MKHNRQDVSTQLEPFCITQMGRGPFLGMIFICQARGEPLLKTAEAKEARWINCEELKHIVDHFPNQIYTAFLAALKKYLLSDFSLL